MVMDNGNFLKKKKYLNHLNGHYIGFEIYFMAYYRRKNDIYGLLGVTIKIYETPGAVQSYAVTHTLHITPTTGQTFSYDRNIHNRGRRKTHGQKCYTARPPLHITPTTGKPTYIYIHIKTAVTAEHTTYATA
eukprot:104275_1